MFHVQVQTGGVFSGNVAILWNLSAEELAHKVIEPRNTGEPIWTGGVEYPWDATTVTIYEGPETSTIEDFSSILGPAAYAMTGVLNDVTDDFIQGPPGGVERDSKHEISASQGKAVFLVHGRALARKEETARFLESILTDGWTLIIMGEQPNRGLTLLEKFEGQATESAYAVVLLTPDDEGRLAGTDEWEGRARQNVIFELGYFFGALGRGHVAVLSETGVSKLSDISGLAHIPLDDSGGWKLSLIKELRAADVPVDLGNL